MCVPAQSVWELNSWLGVHPSLFSPSETYVTYSNLEDEVLQLPTMDGHIVNLTVPPPAIHWHSHLKSFKKRHWKLTTLWLSLKLKIRNSWLLVCLWEIPRLLLVRPSLRRHISNLPPWGCSPTLPRTHQAFPRMISSFLFYYRGGHPPSALVWSLLDLHFPCEIAWAAGETCLLVNPKGTEGISQRQLVSPQHWWHHRRF